MLTGTGKREYEDMAEELYLNAISDVESENTEIYDHMGKLCFERGEYDEAIGWYEKAVPSDHSKKYDIAVCFEYKHDYKKALSLFREYAAEFGTGEELEHEMAFLESRLR